MSGTMATITLVGRLTRDAELKYTNSGISVMNCTVATDKRQKQGDEWKDTPSFWDCVLWGKRAEQLVNYLTKGKLISCVGEPYTETWQKDGQEHRRTKVEIGSLVLLSSRAQESARSDGTETKALLVQQATSQTPEVFDDIPF